MVNLRHNPTHYPLPELSIEAYLEVLFWHIEKCAQERYEGDSHTHAMVKEYGYSQQSINDNCPEHCQQRARQRFLSHSIPDFDTNKYI